MKVNQILATSIFLLLTLLFSSCNNSTGIEDGFTINGTVSDVNNGAPISSVKILVGYNSSDSTSFLEINVFSDNSGKFIYYGGPGTAPSDETLRFVHENYFTKDIVLKNSAVHEDNFYTITVSLQHK